jgi:hypothetical protein
MKSIEIVWAELRQPTTRISIQLIHHENTISHVHVAAFVDMRKIKFCNHVTDMVPNVSISCVIKLHQNMEVWSLFKNNLQFFNIKKN